MTYCVTPISPGPHLQLLTSIQQLYLRVRATRKHNRCYWQVTLWHSVQAGMRSRNSSIKARELKKRIACAWNLCSFMIEVKSHGTKGCWMELQIHPHQSSALCFFLTLYMYTVFPLVEGIFTIRITKKNWINAMIDSAVLNIDYWFSG